MSKHKEKQAICIGAGFGGIAAALRLKALGYDVTLVDKMTQLGGRAQVFEKDGFFFDAGPTVLTAPFLFEELFKLFNKNLNEYVELIPLDLWYRYLFEDGTTFDYGSNLDETVSQVHNLNPSDVRGYKKLLEFSEKIFHVGFDRLSCQPFHRIATLLRTIPQLIKLKSYRSVYGLVSSYIKNEHLRRCFSISPLLVGGNPFDTTSIYALIHFLERKWGIHFAKGGTGSLVKAFEKLLTEVGVKIKLNTTVTQILVEQGKVQGIELSNGTILKSDVVVVNGDPSFTYKNLIAATHRKKWTDKKIDKLFYSMGLFVLYFGTKKRYEEVAHHSIVFGNSYKELLRDIFNNGIVSDDPSLYIHRPTATDPDMAPEGCDSFYALAPVPNLANGTNWDEMGPLYQEKLIDLIEKRLLPNLRENLATCFHVTPKYFEREHLSELGAGFSIAPVFRQSAYFRFHNKSEDIESLYFVGAGTHPGAGLPGVLSSAKVVQNIIKEEGGS